MLGAREHIVLLLWLWLWPAAGGGEPVRRLLSSG